MGSEAGRDVSPDQEIDFCTLGMFIIGKIADSLVCAPAFAVAMALYHFQEVAFRPCWQSWQGSSLDVENTQIMRRQSSSINLFTAGADFFSYFFRLDASWWREVFKF